MPKIPSPDAALIGLAERLAAIPQRRGVPLPLVLMPIPFVETVGVLVVGSIMLAIQDDPNGRMIGGVFLMIGLVDLLTNTLAARRRLRDGRGWGPELAARYRAEALQAREAYLVHRMIYGLIAAVALAMFVSMVGSRHAVIVAIAFSFIVWPLGRLAQQYSECVMPTDPDLRVPQAVPQGA